MVVIRIGKLLCLHVSLGILDQNIIGCYFCQIDQNIVSKKKMDQYIITCYFWQKKLLLIFINSE